MQTRWILILKLSKAISSPQIDFQAAAPSSLDLLDPLNSNDLSSAFLDSSVFCNSGTQDEFDAFDNSLIARTADNPDFPAASTDLWDLEDPQTIDDLWSSGPLGETDWPLDLTMYPGEPSLNVKAPSSDAPPTDVCAVKKPAEKPAEKKKGDWEPPWVPIDPEQPDRDCLDDDWEKFCCPLNIAPLAGTDGCVQYDPAIEECSNLYKIYCCYNEQEDWMVGFGITGFRCVPFISPVPNVAGTAEQQPYVPLRKRQIFQVARLVEIIAGQKAGGQGSRSFLSPGP